MVVHETPRQNTRRRRQRSSGHSAHSNSLHTAKSFGDCQTPNCHTSPLAATQNSISPKLRRRAAKPVDEESLRNSVVDFDAQIFLSIWRQLIKQEIGSGRQSEENVFSSIEAIDEWKSEFDQKPLPSGVSLANVLSASFSHENCTLLTSDGKAVGVNRELVIGASNLLRLEVRANARTKMIYLPIRFDPLVVVIAAIYQRETGDMTLMSALLDNMDLPQLFEIFEVAVRLNVPFFTEFVGKQMLDCATPSTYVVTYRHLKTFCPEIAERLWSKIVADFYRVCLTRTHKLLHASELKRALFNERINIGRGDEIGIVRQWARFNRHEYQSVEFQNLRRQVTDSLLGSMGRSRHQRLPYSVLFALGGWGTQGPTDKLEIMNGYTENWIEPRFSIGDLISPRCYYSAVSMPEKASVYVMGGFDGTRYYDGSTRFNLETLTWDESSFAPLHERRCYINATRMDSNHILACGGYNNAVRMTSAEILDVKRNQWSRIASMNTVRSDAHAVELDGRVYVLGGFDGSTCHRSVEFYDPHHNQWSMLQREMREKRSGIAALSIYGALFAVGGFTGRERLSSAEFWDPREGQWHSVSKMILNRSNFGISELRSDPICIGGYDGHGTTEMCERFDWRANRWTSLPSLRFRRSALSVFRVDNLKNVERFFTN